MPTHVVTALSLNLRSTPNPGLKNKIAVLPQGTPVDKITNSATAGWWEVDAQFAGQVLRGFVNSAFLGPVGATFPSATASGGVLPPADLGRSASAKRNQTGGRAHQIGEAGRPGTAGSHAGGKAAGIVAVIDWLDVGKSSHLRWQPAGGSTFCNVYTYDVCIIAGCYLPRVWWTPGAIDDLKAGNTVEAKYDDTVKEIRANNIFDWLEEYGSSFGWQRLFDVDALQTDANNGRVGIICAQRVQLNKPGHIQIIAPEHGPHVAKRSAAGKVTQPLQSNAGSSTFTYGFLNNTWWSGSSFREFGFWSADPT